MYLVCLSNPKEQELFGQFLSLCRKRILRITLVFNCLRQIIPDRFPFNALFLSNRVHIISMDLEYRNICRTCTLLSWLSSSKNQQWLFLDLYFSSGRYLETFDLIKSHLTCQLMSFLRAKSNVLTWYSFLLVHLLRVLEGLLYFCEDQECLFF